MEGLEDIELAQVDEYDTFEDKGKGYKPGPDYKKINIHIVYAVKHDGRHKSRLVAGGHLTDTPIDSVYSSVVSLRGIRLLTFIAELNDMECWATDIGNAYLESVTKEKVYIIAGPEFGAEKGIPSSSGRRCTDSKAQDSDGTKDSRSYYGPWGSSFHPRQRTTSG